MLLLYLCVNVLIAINPDLGHYRTVEDPMRASRLEHYVAFYKWFSSSTPPVFHPNHFIPNVLFKMSP